MKSIFILCLMVGLNIFLVEAQTLLWIDDFDGSNLSNPPEWSYRQFCTDRDYFDIVRLRDDQNHFKSINSSFYKKTKGNFVGVRDMDHHGCQADISGEKIVYKNIDISSSLSSRTSRMYLCLSLAESKNRAGVFGIEWGTYCNCEDTWDSDTSLKIYASVDDAPIMIIAAVESSHGSNSRPAIDLDCNGKAADDPSIEVSDVFTQYCFEFGHKGRQLDLFLEFVGFNTGGEDIAVDDISIYSISKSECPLENPLRFSACNQFLNEVLND